MSFSLPAKNVAVVGSQDGKLELRTDIELPELAEDMVLLRNRAVALNPIDVKMVGVKGTPGAVAGMDFAGEVIAIGDKAQTAAELKIGDRVCGVVPGMHAMAPRVGAFATIVGAADITTLKMPDSMSFAEGATLGVGLGTAIVALFKSLDVPGTLEKPAEKPVDVLVYGGSTSTGIQAIQLLKLAGLNAITTCSPHNFDLVQSYGATAAFDYHDATECAAAIKKHTRNALKYVLDCVSEPETTQLSYACLGRAGGKYTAVNPYLEVLHTRPKTVKADWVLGPVMFGKKPGWPEPFNRDGGADALEFSTKQYSLVQKLLDQGKLRPHPIRQMPGGLAGVFEGLDLLRKNQVSGHKLVYTLD